MEQHSQFEESGKILVGQSYEEEMAFKRELEQKLEEEVGSIKKLVLEDTSDEYMALCAKETSERIVKKIALSHGLPSALHVAKQLSFRFVKYFKNIKQIIEQMPEEKKQAGDKLFENIEEHLAEMEKIFQSIEQK